MELGQKIRAARLEAGLSQRELCGDTITRNMLSLIENGSARPSMDTLQILATRLHKTVGYFLEEGASCNEHLMQALRQAKPEQVAELLKDYVSPDPVFDRERYFLESNAYLALSRQALQEGKKAYAQTLWETTATVSELALVFLTPIWCLGLVSVVLGCARGKEAQTKVLTAGFNRFFAGLGLHLLTILLYIFASLITIYIGTALMSFMADMHKLDTILQPFAQSIEQNPEIVSDPAFLRTLPWGELLACLWLPILFVILITVVFIAFLSYRLRLARYFLMDGLGMGAMQAVRKSFSSMKGNVFAFIRLDLSYWWYYGLMILFGTSSLLNLIPFLLGMPQVSDLAAIGIQFLSSAALCPLYWWKGAQVETTFALAYENLKIKTL